MTAQLENDVLDSAKAIQELEDANTVLRDDLAEARFHMARMGSELAALSGELRTYRNREQQERTYHQQLLAQHAEQLYQAMPHNPVTQQAQLAALMQQQQNYHSQQNQLSEEMRERICHCIPDRASFLSRVADMIR